MKVFVTSSANKEFDELVGYIQIRFGSKSTKTFIAKVDRILRLLSKFPLIGQPDTKDIRGFQLTKQIRVLYRIREERIIIISFFDVRQNPSNKPE
jgi:plasmid stabilization system protein ParE